MPVTANDIKFVLSGGAYNAEPSQSVGGEPSSRVIWGTTNNLFDDVGMIEAEDGSTDYRCVYVVNNHASESLYDCQITILSEVAGGSNIEIGVAKETDVQQIFVSGAAEGGNFKIAYEGHVVTVDWSLVLATWAQNLQAALNSIPDLGGVSVGYSSYTSNSIVTRVFEVQFQGKNDFRYHSLLTLSENNLSGNPTIQINKYRNGSPINAIAPLLDTDIIEPYGVTWKSGVDVVSVGTLNAGDSFPVWVKRATPAESSPIKDDGFTLRVMGKPFE